MYLNNLNLIILHWVIFFKKGLDTDDKKEGLFKRPKNVKDKNKELLKEIKNQKTKELGNKDSQAAKAKNSVIYDENHNFDLMNHNHRLDKFSNLPSIESKLDMLETLYKEFISLKYLDAKTK